MRISTLIKITFLILVAFTFIIFVLIKPKGLQEPISETPGFLLEVDSAAHKPNSFKKVKIKQKQNVASDRSISMSPLSSAENISRFTSVTTSKRRENVLADRFFSRKSNVKTGFLMSLYYTAEKTLPDDTPSTLLMQVVVSSIEFTSASSFKSHLKNLPESFIATFDGEFEIKIIGTYTFCGTSGAGGRLYMDGQMLSETEGGEGCGSLNVIPGRHVLRFESLRRGAGQPFLLT